MAESGRGLFLAASLVWFIFAGPAYAGTTGKLSGRIVDKEKKPVVAATVTIVGTRFGAFTDAEGNYNILNVPPGTYEVNVSRLGFKGVSYKNIAISADNTTRLDIDMEVAAVQMETVVVTAERPQVDVNATSTTATLSTEEIEALPVQELQDVVNLQAGVVDGHIRGGRKEEVQYQVDGVTVNNPFDNTSTIRIDRSLLQEVQVISGTFDAEYGQAMSGVVNAVLKEGAERFEWNGELLAGGFAYEGARRRWAAEFRPTGIQGYQFSASGPIVPGTVFLASGRRSVFDDYLYGERRFMPTDTSKVNSNQYYPTGDGASVALGYSREWSGLAKITNTSFPETKLSYQFLFNDRNGRNADFTWRFNPEGMKKQKSTSIVHGLDVTQTFSGSTFLDLSLRQNYYSYRDMAYEDVFDPRYDAAGSPEPAQDVYARDAFVHGVDFGRFRQRMNTWLFKAELVSQVNSQHLVKLGIEPQFPTVAFGSPGVLDNVGSTQFVGRFLADGTPFDSCGCTREEFQALPEYKPFMAAAFLQDQMEWEDLTLRGGLRFEYFDARARIPSDLANPANAIEGVPASRLVETSVKLALAPRLGVAYPITDRAGVHFAYGHFYQWPTLKDMFENSDYSVLEDLQASSTQYDVVFGNPDVKAQKTVAYEFGYKHALNDRLSGDLTLFYKDIRDLLGVEFISTYNDAEYARLTNVDYGSVVGFTLTLDQRNIGPLSTSVDYTWQKVRGQASDPRETATRAEAGEDPRPRLVPLNWDQRHTLNVTATLSSPRDYTASAIFRAASGQPYTPALDTGPKSDLETNSGRKPGAILLDLRAEKHVTAADLSGSLFARVFNALDTRYFNGSVFALTGSPYYSLPGADLNALEDPLRLYQPRRIEVGITFGSRNE